MRTQHGKLEESNYWPGYVDALVNVVLNMLFMVGIMAVGLVSLNMEALSNRKLARQAEQLYQINEENMLLAALGTFIAVIPDVPKAVDAKPLATPAPTPVPVPARPEPVRQETTRPASTLRVVAAAPTGKFASGDEKLQLSERLQWGDQAVVAVVEFEPFVFQLSGGQNQQIRQLVAQNQGSRWSLAVAADGDERAVREAFWRLSQVRQELLAAGVPQAAINLRTVNMLPSGVGSSRRIFLALTRQP